MIWLTSPPISVNVTGGVYVQGMDERGFRFNVMEGNLMVATTTASHGYDVIDLHYHMLHQIHKRMPDGIHWTQQAVRFQLNTLPMHQEIFYGDHLLQYQSNLVLLQPLPRLLIFPLVQIVCRCELYPILFLGLAEGHLSI